MALIIGTTSFDHVVKRDRVAYFAVLDILKKVLHTYKRNSFSDWAKCVKFVCTDVQAAQRALTHEWCLLQGLDDPLHLMAAKLAVLNAKLLYLAQLLEIGD